MLPLIDGYPIGLYATILAYGYSNGLHTAMLVE